VCDADVVGRTSLDFSHRIHDEAKQLRHQPLGGGRRAADDDRRTVTDASLELARDALRLADRATISCVADEVRPVLTKEQDGGNRCCAIAERSDLHTSISEDGCCGERCAEIDAESVGHSLPPRRW
jgi:hypothetical protein